MKHFKKMIRHRASLHQQHDMKKLFFTAFAFMLMLLLGATQNSSAFCGFYVAKADAELFNESSQVILVRDGNKTVITMANDYQGEVKDFAMVVPVPVVLKEKDIRVVEKTIFDRLDAYSGPRLVEYHDENPCQLYDYELLEEVQVTSMARPPGRAMKKEAKKDKVTIEASYTIGEYDILILSAKESDGLERWLIRNDYKIPEGANEVLQPYILNEMKFFVVKVNLKNQKKSGYDNLRPLQMEFESKRFGLPIRLGMANSSGTQDLIVYAFTKTGRVETTNYRTVKIPTDRNIPEFIKPSFGQFYVDVYKNAWEKEGENAVFLEYSWDLNSSNFVKCDPCNTTPPTYAELQQAGVKWVNNHAQGRWGGADYEGNVHFTRLHVRYGRDKFPQDLRFQETPNKELFQGRYIMQHPVQGALDCDAAQDYYLTVADRRNREIQELGSLTGWETEEYAWYPKEYYDKVNIKKQEKDKNGFIVLPFFNNLWGQWLALSTWLGVGLIGVLLGMRLVQWRQKARFSETNAPLD